MKRRISINVHLIIAIGIAMVFTCCTPDTERLTAYEVHGIDISHHQATINWDTLAYQDLDFVFFKATEGESFKDTLFQHNWRASEKSGILKGAYHFFLPDSSPEAQFLNFSETVDLKPGEFPPVLDIEIGGKASPEELRKSISVWLELAEGYYGVRPIIYTYQKFYNQFLKSEFMQYPLWIARYHSIEPELEDSARWQFWQYGERGRLPGIEGFVDFNVFNGSLPDLKDLLIEEDSITSALFSY